MRIKAVIAVALCLGLLCVPKTVSAKVETTPEGIKFDAEFYATNNPELIEKYGNTFEGLYRHYLEHGRQEGRYVNEEEKNEAIAKKVGVTGDDSNAAGVGSSSNTIGGYSSENVVLNPNSASVFVGDSRTYLMHKAVGEDGSSWIGYPGTKIETLSGTIVPIIDSMNLANKKIVILYGINDITTKGAQKSYDDYNKFMTTKAQEWIGKGATVYFANIIGINNSIQMICPDLTDDAIRLANEQVVVFNNLINGFPSNIRRVKIDVAGNSLYDGIHYDSNACIAVYNQINKQL